MSDDVEPRPPGWKGWRSSERTLPPTEIRHAAIIKQLANEGQWSKKQVERVLSAYLDLCSHHLAEGRSVQVGRNFISLHPIRRHNRLRLRVKRSVALNDQMKGKRTI